MKVFIYGTLKSGMKNHSVLKTFECEKICDAITVETYPMFQLSDPFPYVANKPGIGYNIIGELYEINDKFINRLDSFEGVPHLYVRGKINVSKIGQKSYEEVNVYFIANEPKYLEKLNFINKWEE